MRKSRLFAFLPLMVFGAAHAATAQLVSRDGPDVVTVRAVRVDAPLKVDGRLDEAVYGVVEPIHDFIQQEPHEKEPATERTDAWVLFDDTNVYIAARLWDSHPERDIANVMQRDGNNMSGNENLVVILDTFHDRRNGFMFQANEVGGMRDLAINDDGQHDSWNGVWDVRTAKFDQGWTVEFTIPFKTLRYGGAGLQEWGVNFRRVVKWKNEVSYLSLVPAALGMQGVSRIASAATLVGMETPSQSINLELKPYAESSLTTDHAAKVPFTNDFKGGAGLDLKYGLTRGLIADLTVNPDFAQVEEDLQQVNLTRFSVFFPEKRSFFLEGQGIFDFGGVQANSSPGDVPLMFFSRQIGFSQGQDVPVVAGGRVTGKVGQFSVGAVNVATAEKASSGAVATDFSAVRVKREILRRSVVGVIGTRRNHRPSGAGENATFGADAALNFFRTVSINSYYAQTSTPGLSGGTSSYRGRFDYTADRYGFSAEHLLVGAHFNPEVGYAQRVDINKNYLYARFSPRPKGSRFVRKLTWQGSLTYISDARRAVTQKREPEGTFVVDFQNSDQLTVNHTRDYELLPANFKIATGVVVPAGGYNYYTSKVAYTLGAQRRVAGTVSAATGTLYGGTKTAASYGGRVVILPRWFSLEPGLTLNWVQLPYGDFNASLVTSRLVVTPSPRMLIGSLIQFNKSAHTLSSSVRLRWEYVPGSELFVVYSDGRDTLANGFPGLLNKTFVVKVTRLLRF